MADAAHEGRGRALMAARDGEPLADAAGGLFVASARRPERVDVALRALDLTIASVGLIVLSPLFVLATVVVGVGSGRPILYRGARVGRGGQVFTMVKFRTLPLDAEQRFSKHLGSELSRLSANEAGALGRVLRASQLDELPQLWNVLRGHMSIVGPRPIRPIFFEELTHEIPQYWQRLVVRPGLTGLAQLRMTREMSWQDKLSHDLEWIADRCASLYLQVALATAVRLVTRPLRQLAGRRRG